MFKFKNKKSKEKFLLTSYITCSLIVTILLSVINFEFLAVLFKEGNRELIQYINSGISIMQGIVVVIYILTGEKSFKMSMFLITACYLCIDFNALMLKYL